LAACAAALAQTFTPAHAGEVLMPQTLTIDLDPADPDNTTLGELSYRGGLEILPGEEEIGGIAGLSWWGGELYAVTDDGRWLIMTPNEFRDQLNDVIEIELGPLLDERGKKLRRKDEAQANAIVRGDAGDWLVGFANDGRVWRYPSFEQAAQTTALGLAGMPGANSAAAVELPDGRAPTAAACASNGVCYLLLSAITGEPGATIIAVGPDGSYETAASWAAPLAIGDFSGLAVREEGPKTYLYIVSNNGHRDGERTMLMKFEVNRRAAEAPGVPERVYATTRVVLETTMGAITVALETERAPITAANFLRYVDEDRYDGTKCYRAMQHKQLDEPSGFLQCGTQNHPDRILPGIAHEPTSETGLSHTDGALSMARFDPGTATGDFSIMIKDQRGLDAQPDADDPALRPGFAVFGYVVEGMDVVHAIHATPVDPDAGEGFLKGQMLAKPVTIVNVRRAEPATD